MDTGLQERTAEGEVGILKTPLFVCVCVGGCGCVVGSDWHHTKAVESKDFAIMTVISTCHVPEELLIHGLFIDTVSITEVI
jgi:hypothetical protein